MLIKKDKLPELIKGLKTLYPKTKTALAYKDAFELLCAVILSAQCTDKRVNMVTPALFKKFPNPQAMAKADIAEIEAIIKSIELKFPKPDEQQKIANFLSSIDDEIAAQAKKLEGLKEHKKGLMQGMFPVVSS